MTDAFQFPIHPVSCTLEALKFRYLIIHSTYWVDQTLYNTTTGAVNIVIPDNSIS
jgi:hypothetical protein